MTANDLIESLAKENVSVILTNGSKTTCNLTKAAAGRVIEFLARTILADLLLDGRSTFPNLGIFTVVTRAAQHYVPPKGEPVDKPARKTIKFKPYSSIKEQL